MGADGIIAKPFSSEVLMKAIQNALQPVATRWSSAQPSSSQKISGQFNTIGNVSANLGIALGRGGFYLQGFQELGEIPLGSNVNYEFSFLTGDVKHLEGSATLVWRRLHPEKPLSVEAGLAISSLDSSCRDSVIAYIVNQKLIPFIPNHHNE
jgi:hypothetical protein